MQNNRAQANPPTPLYTPSRGWTSLCSFRISRYLHSVKCEMNTEICARSSHLHHHLYQSHCTNCKIFCWLIHCAWNTLANRWKSECLKSMIVFVFILNLILFNMKSEHARIKIRICCIYMMFLCVNIEWLKNNWIIRIENLVNHVVLIENWWMLFQKVMIMSHCHLSSLCLHAWNVHILLRSI